MKPTLKVRYPLPNGSDFCWINESDFDPALHQKYEEADDLDRLLDEIEAIEPPVDGDSSLPESPEQVDAEPKRTPRRRTSSSDAQ